MPKSLHAIEFLSERIGDVCFKGNIRYSANIISNGYLLDRTVAERLAKWGITLAQITLDGPREQHNRTRVLKNGSGTFDRIVENIKSCGDLLRFSIRMNVTTENSWSVAELKRLLREKGILDDPKRTAFYISPVRSYTSTCKSTNCMSNESLTHCRPICSGPGSITMVLRLWKSTRRARTACALLSILAPL